ncbi:MAG: CDP-diacylglycerol--glycerol-3-phosphate 3-phosphatidyltransferase [Planctomycetaceae bacterium]|nr:CDP-diacylglycerol--glycerol-3-phosphate 3-phosphatidyltransferase [Planctomycetaceae bacterium]
MATTEQREPTGIDAARTSAAKARLGSPLNLPNVITVSRLILSVVLFWLIDRGNHWLAACGVFVIAAATDAVDGYIARRYGLVTVVGRILDPFVDKVIIGGAFVFLAVQPDSGVNAWMAIIVIGREMFITSLRSFLESEGRDFSATWSGKLKMVLQCAAVAASLLYLEYGAAASSPAVLSNGRDLLLWSAIGITIYSGVIYVVRAVQMFRDAA